MNTPKETQDGFFIMRYKAFVPMMIAIIMGTNTASIFYQKQSHNTEQIEYNKKRSDRIAERKLQEAKLYHDIERLKEKLEECENSKN
jgi:hypothetical protein